jgi:hypothetical protein
MRAANGRGDLVLRRQSYLLRAIRDIAHAPRVTLRTGRHQFTANMRKASYSREERAAALGHASADTSDDHYGKPNRGWKGLRRWIEPCLSGLLPSDCPFHLRLQMRHKRNPASMRSSPCAASLNPTLAT